MQTSWAAVSGPASDWRIDRPSGCASNLKRSFSGGIQHALVCPVRGHKLTWHCEQRSIRNPLTSLLGSSRNMCRSLSLRYRYQAA